MASGGAETNPPLWWLLDVEVMPLASHILDQVAGPLLKGPVGRQIRVVMLDPADVCLRFVGLCAFHIACYTLQATRAAAHPWKPVWCTMLQLIASWSVAAHRQQV